MLYSLGLSKYDWSHLFMKHRFPVLLIMIVLMSSLVSGIKGGSVVAGAGAPQRAENEFLKNFTDAVDIIQNNYVDNVGSDKLIYSAIKGMLRALDPHSSFFEPKEFTRLREEQHSKYYGLGIRVRPLFRERGRVVIVEPPAIGSPAERRGLRAGDVVVKIEGESIDDWTSDEVVSHLRGPRGTTVNITVERPSIRDPLQFRIERDEIPIITVPYAFEVKPGIGYIKIDRFSESTADELGQKIKALKEGDGNLQGLILDLRDNPGGLLNQAIEVSDYFIERGKLIVSTKGRADGSVRPYKTSRLEKLQVPLVVLINRHSASASEIVAGALQDHDRALIVGETSFGKGLVQSVYQLENNTGMALTTAKYYTPSGRLIQRDYSGSSFDYYYLSSMNSTGKERETKYTDGGRKVLGGGGIAPDVEVLVRELSRFEALLSTKDAFFEYARRLTSGQVLAASNFQIPQRSEEVNTPAAKSSRTIPKLEISDAILDDFKKFLRSRNIEFTDEDIKTNEDFIKRRIKQEVYTSSFGLQEGFKIAVQGDTQVLKALDVMPAAKELMANSRTAPAPDRKN